MTLPTKLPSIGLRLSSMFIDHFAMTFIICIGGLILTLPLSLIPENTFPTGLRLIGGGLIGTIVFVLASLYFNKDILNGQSIAKRILKLQVVDNTTKNTATPMQCLLRNLTIIILPIEVIVIFFNPNRRLGDRIANTRVVFYNEEKEKLKWRQILPTLFIGLIAFIIILAVTMIFQLTAK